MQSADYEKFVEAHLLNQRDTLVAPQYLIRASGRDRWVDILAVRPREKVFYLVEVTENRNPAVITRKFADYTQDAPHIARCLAEEIGFDGPWTVMPWLFIRRDAAAAFEAALTGIAHRREFIEDIVQRAPAGKDTLDAKRWGLLKSGSTKNGSN